MSTLACDAVLGAGHVDQGADGLGRPSPAPDHPSHVVGCHVQAEAQAAPTLFGVDDHRVGLVGERAGQVAEHGQRGPAVEGVVALVALVVDVGVASSVFTSSDELMSTWSSPSTVLMSPAS